MIYIEHGGRRTLAQTANLTLYYWLMARCPASFVKATPDQLLVVQDLPAGLPQPGEQVVALAVAAAEREFGRTPTYETGGTLEERSQGILDWLKEFGDISKLELRD